MAPDEFFATKHQPEATLRGTLDTGYNLASQSAHDVYMSSYLCLASLFSPKVLN